ncbi:MAG: hypothetical protein RJA36_3940 [Pseudomonadota bacterium]|jgi:hypothetical protein
MSRLSHIATLRPAGAAHRLHALVLDRHDQPFAWGIRDCCLWAADAVYAVTLRDMASDIRGSYWSARQAARVLRDRGGLEAMVTQRMGEPINAAEAIDGDVCLLVPQAHETLPEGVGALGVLWRGSILAQAKRGLCVHRANCAQLWWGAQP